MNSLLSKIYELSAPRQLYLKEEVIELATLAADEIAAETVYSAVSPGTEIAAYSGVSPLRSGNPYPRVVGYCNVARVIAKGNLVSDYKPGDHILTFQSHRTCFKCAASDVVAVIDPSINYGHAATAYLYHLGWHGLLTAEVKPGDKVAIIGSGTLGYTSAIMSLLNGADTTVFTNQQVDSLYRNTAVKIESKTTDSSSMIEASFNIVINTSNTWDDWMLCLKLVSKGGTIVNLGFPGRGQQHPQFNPLDPQYVYTKNVTIKALHSLSSDEIKSNLAFILDKMKQGLIIPDIIISSKITFTDLPAQYENYLNRSQPLLTTLINWKNIEA